MWGGRVRNVGRGRMGLVVGIAIITIFTFGIIFFMSLHHQSTMVPSTETIGSGDFFTVPIPIKEDAIHLTIRVDMDANHEMDIYLLEGERMDDIFAYMDGETPAVRSAVAHQGVVEWKVPESEFPDGLLLVIDNTNRGEVPATGGDIGFIYSLEIVSLADPFSSPGFYVVLMVTGVMLGLVVLTYVGTRKAETPPPEGPPPPEPGY